MALICTIRSHCNLVFVELLLTHRPTLNLGCVQKKFSNCENIHFKIVFWFDLLGSISLLFAGLLCVDWSHNRRNKCCLHSFSVKTAESPRNLVFPQNNEYQMLLHLAARSPVCFQLQFLSVLYMQWHWLDTLSNYVEGISGRGSD